MYLLSPTLLQICCDIFQRRLSEQRLKLSALLLRAVDHPGSGRECVRLPIGGLRRRHPSRPKPRLRLRYYDPIFVSKVLFLHDLVCVRVGSRTGVDPLVANLEDFLADPLGLHGVGDGRRHMLGGGLHRAEASFRETESMRSPDVEQVGKINTIVIIVAQIEPRW